MNRLADQESEPLPSVEEELVAYLDGELDDDAARQVEARLASDAEYRAELAKLQNAWDCLDQLPETTVDPAFTRGTIEMVTLAAREEINRAETELPQRKRKQRLRLAGILFAAAALGFLGAMWLWPSAERKLAADLPVLENLDLYLPIDNIDFLRTLSQQVSFPTAQALATSEAEEDEVTPRETRVKVTTVSDISQLSAPEKNTLAVNQQRFSRLEASERARLRNLASEVSSAEDHAALQTTLVEYHQWLMELSPGAQADLAGLPTTRRVTEVQRMIEQQEHRRQRYLSADDRRALLNFLGSYLPKHKDQLMADYPESRRQEMDRWLEKAEPRQRSGILLMLFLRQRRGSDHQSPALPVDEESLRELFEKLSPAARAQWEEMETAEDRQRLLQSWASHAVRHRMIERTSMRDAREISQEALANYFAQELSTDERARLLAMPTEEMDRELRRVMLEGDKPGRGLGRFGFGFPPPHGGPQGHRERGPRHEGPPWHKGPPPRHEGGRHEGPPPRFGGPPIGPPPHEGPPQHAPPPPAKQ